MTLPNYRMSLSLIFISVVGLMGYGLYTQYYQGLEPCPLCMTQRLFYCLIGSFALLGLLHNPQTRGQKVYSLLMLVASIGGIASAGRQVWLQHLPPEEVPACGPSLEYMLEVFPFTETLKMMVMGDGNCAEVIWSFMGLSMGEWSLLWFIGFSIASLWLLLRRQ
jgi:protein dithiol:quinone oxidoreductase